MKKLMISACAVALAVVTHAASTSWSCDGVITAGTDLEGWTDFEYAPAGWSVYFFDQNGSVSYSQMAAALAADNFANELSYAILDGNGADHVLIKNDSGMGDFKASGQTMDGNPSDTIKAYAVIFDAATAAEAKNAFMIDVQSAVLSSSSMATFVPDYSATFGAPGYVDARDGWTAVNVPEPTSGLLLLLGVAGLALRRRRA